MKWSGRGVRIVGGIGDYVNAVLIYKILKIFLIQKKLGMVEISFSS